MGRVPPSDDDKAAALELFEAFGRGDDLQVIVENARLRHPKNDTFPGDVFLDVARDALDLAGAGRDDPIRYEGFVDAHLADWHLRGREKSKFQYAVMAAASHRGGIEPDLLGETYWWNTDDFWFYGTLTAIACIRAAAARRSEAVAAVCQQLATRWSAADRPRGRA
jgi:hypothetical protein